MAIDANSSSTVAAPSTGPGLGPLVFRPLVISGMMACIAAGWVAVVQLYFPDWNGTYLVIMVALLTLEMLVSEQVSRRLLEPSQRTSVRVAEIVLTLLLLKPMTYLHRGWAALVQDARGWLYHPSAFFMDPEYGVALLVLLGLWFIALDIGRTLEDLEDPYTGASRREAQLAYLNGRFIFGALFLLGAAGVVQVQLTGQGIRLRPVEMSSLTWLPLVYLGLGLLLFGQARLALLQAGWQRQGVPVSPKVSRRWASWGLLFVGGVSLLALLLPAASTEAGFYLFVWLSFLAAVVGGVLIFFLQLLLYVILLPILVLLRTGNLSRPQSPALPPLPPPPPDVPASVPAWWTYLRLTLFWVGVLVAVFLVVRQYVRQRQGLGTWTALRRGIGQWLVDLWHALLARWRGLTKQAGALWRRPLQAQEPEGREATPGWWQRWRARTQRERVRRLYLVMLERARRVGHARVPSQTPYEFAGRLAPHVTGEEEALTGLTEAFVEARYSQRDFQEEEVGFLRRLLDRVRRRLRRQ
jgi:hypothetical protein